MAGGVLYEGGGRCFLRQRGPDREAAAHRRERPLGEISLECVDHEVQRWSELFQPRSEELVVPFDDFDPAWLPLLAAAAAEIASAAGISWRFSSDDSAVALLRLIAKVTITVPGASGPHTGRLLTKLP